jgi:hypothetical protein
MKAEQIADIVMADEFHPFDVVLRSGERIEVRRPLRALLTAEQLCLGVDEDRQTGLSARLRRLPLREISSVRVVGSNGAKSRKR